MVSVRSGDGRQKRAFVRADVALSFRYGAVREAPRRFMPDESGMVSGRTYNLSGGGFLFSGERDYPVGQLLELELLVPSPAPRPVRALGRIVREENGEDGRRYALRFEAIDEYDRDRLVGYIFERLRMESIAAAREGA